MKKWIFLLLLFVCGTLVWHFGQRKLSGFTDQSSTAEDPSLGQLLELIKDSKTETIDQWLNEIAKKYPAYFHHYTLMYRSGSFQTATALQPRVIAFGNSAKTIFAFNAENPDPAVEGTNTLELIGYHEESRKFEFREVVFKKEVPKKSHFPAEEVEYEDSRIRISTKDPVACMDCHSRFTFDPHPIWESYFVWPGAFGSVEDGYVPQAKIQPPMKDTPYAGIGREITWTGANPELLARTYFQTQVAPNSPRYKSLLAQKGYIVTDLAQPNFEFLVKVSLLNDKRIARIVEGHAPLQPFYLALLGTLICNAPMDDKEVLPDYLDWGFRLRFIPKRIGNVLPDTREELSPILQSVEATAKASTLKSLEQLQTFQLQVKEELLRSPLLNSKDREALMDFQGLEIKPYVAQDFKDRLPQFMNIVVGSGLSMDNWAMGQMPDPAFHTGISSHAYFRNIVNFLIEKLNLPEVSQGDIESLPYRGGLRIKAAKHSAVCKELANKSGRALE